MGSRNPDRIPRLRSLNQRVPGFIQVGICGGCGYMAALPLAALLRRYGELYPVESAMMNVRCTDCGEAGKTQPRIVRLCDRGCPKQRG